MNTARDVWNELKRNANPARAKSSEWFFKTEKGQYGADDRFLGITVPLQRAIAKKHKTLPLHHIQVLLESAFHECRLTALFILVGQYQIADAKGKARIARFYLKNRKRVNNWDLVDASASYVLGDYLFDKSRAILYKMARSKSLWDRRIAVLAAGGFVKHGDFRDLVTISEMLLKDTHDLIHKAVGWMLREMGKRDTRALEAFLKKHTATMPRTMLRYAIEKFPEKQRKSYLAIKMKR